MYRLILLVLLIPSVSFSQNTLGTQSSGIDFDNYSFGAIDQFDQTKSNLTGSPYLFENFKDLIVITDANDSIVFNESNFNLSTMNLEFKKDDGMHFFSSKYFNTFFDNEILEKRYIIKKFSSIEEEQITGLFKIFSEKSNYSLLKHFQFKIKDSNYNPVLEHGDRNDKIIIKEDLYLLHDYQLIPIRGSKRKFSKHFSKNNEILSYIRDKKISFKNTEDLSELTDFLDNNEFEVNR